MNTIIRNRGNGISAVVLMASLAMAATIPALGQTNGTSLRLIGGGRLRSTTQLPPGKLRDRLESLPAPARGTALQWLNRVEFPPEDVASLYATEAGEIYYACTFPGAPATAAPAASAPASTDPQAAAVPVSPFPDALKFHSRPGSANVIYLDFDGGVVTNTGWNSLAQPVFTPLPFSSDTDFSTYSDSEQTVIKRAWQRVAEDFAPFDVDVTTDPPAVTNTTTAVAMITRNTDSEGRAHPASSAGGVAWLDVFGIATYASNRPAWVYANNLGFDEDSIGEIVSHEIGHNLALGHDGQSNGTEYYGGHGLGETSWAPIMGLIYGRNVTTWSKGEYYLANNTQDDTAIIAGKMPYRADDVGNTSGTAGVLVLSNGVFVVSTTPESDPANTNTANKGIVSSAGDADVYAFASAAGPVSLTVEPWISLTNTRGGNLDLRLTLLDAASNIVASADPTATTYAAIGFSATAGTYYLVVSNSAVGTPLADPPSGYTTYGSLGQYFISGLVPGAFTNPVNCEATPDGPELTRLTWLSLGYDALIAHARNVPPSAPVEGNSYSSGSPLATGTVLYKGSAYSAEHVEAPGSTNYYVFYGVDASNHYAVGVTARVVNALYPNGVVEAFCYTSGVNLAGTAGGQGFSNAWATVGNVYVATNGTMAPFEFVEPFSQLSEQRLAIENYTANTEMSARRQFAPLTNGTVYVGYRMAIEYGFDGKYSGVRLLMTNNSEALFVGETGADNTLGIDGIGVPGTNSGAGINAYQFDNGNVYQIVGRFNFATRRVDVKAYHRTQEIPAFEPENWDAHATTAVDRTSISGVELVAGGFIGGAPGRVFFDEVRVAQSWVGLFLDHPTPDSDADGLPDAWELTYSGSPIAEEPDADPDGDGFTNLEEYGASTHPHQNASVPSGAWPRVRGSNGVVVACGDSTPSASDGTDFGGAYVCDGFVDHAFSVTNLGASTLAITSAALTGAVSDFAILSTPATISAGAVSNLLLRFDPVQFGARVATVDLWHPGSSNVPYRFNIRGNGVVITPPAGAVVVPGAPAISGDPLGQNGIGDRFDFVTNGAPWQTTLQCGFGTFGRVSFNYDATNLYIGGEGMNVGDEGSGAILFLGLNTLADDALSPVKGQPFTNPPFGLNLLNNLSFASPMDIAILLGDEYGDGTFRNFQMGNGMDLGQGVFHLNSAYTAITNAGVSQFDGIGTNAALSADDDTNRITDRWEVAIPWADLNAPAGAASVTNLTVLGVMVGGTIFDTRYLSGNFLAAGPTQTVESLDEFNNIGFSVVTLQPYTVGLPGGDHDGDGLPDLWELHVGLNAAASNGLAADTDSDGQSDREEYIADTHPTNGLSLFPPVTNVAGVGVMIINVSPTSTGRVYDVSWKTNLIPDSLPWIPYGFNLPGTGANLVFSITNDVNARFLRTSVRLP